MNLRQLEAFRATMRYGSITEAAEMMHISQPSVSRLIADLERSVGFSLFLRIGRGLTPTIEASTFYHGVEGMFIGIDRLQDLADSIRTASGGVISIGTIQSIASLELPKAVNALYKRYDDIRFMIHSRNTPAILNAIQLRQLDLGVVGRQPPYEGVETLYQRTVPYVCLMPEDHPLIGKAGPVDLEELASKETFVTFGGAFPDDMMSIDSKLSERLQQSSRLSATNMPAAASLVRETGVLAIADPFSAEQAVRIGGVAFRPILQDLTYNVAIVTLGREHLSRYALEFVEFLADQLSKRITVVKNFHN
ncbi:LysR family transcriptional regulator [Kiloniella spongiae]|uniref:LysR family transcriptional regulator n=1 Tax=Kiloniella spongiae TaxID=1489064 RepID=UPI00069B5E6F|nr:LysR family transcriptional regulator [Kiloniella spongiae]